MHDLPRHLSLSRMAGSGVSWRSAESAVQAKQIGVASLVAFGDAIEKQGFKRVPAKRARI
jgi:hypothetical protein